MVPEFRVIVSIVSTPNFLNGVRKIEQAIPLTPNLQCSHDIACLPAGSRVLRRYEQGVSGNCLSPQQVDLEYCDQVPGPPSFSPMGASSPAGPEVAAPRDSRVSSRASSSPLVRSIVGIPWTCQEFIQKAVEAKHPRHMMCGLPAALQETIDYLSKSSPAEIGADRTAEMRKWVQLAKESEEEEMSAKSMMAAHCAEILKSKRVSLFAKMLAAAGHEDESIAKEMRSGFLLGGPIPRSEAFRVKRTSASLTMDDLHEQAPRLRQGILASTKSLGDAELDAATYEATISEVDRGWLEGPLPESSLGPRSLVTRRFGIRQGQKIRPIDNYLESGMNSTSSATDTITVHTADCIAAGLSYRLGNDTKCKDSGLLIRTWDLQKAYKNLPLATEALDDAFLCIFNPAAGAGEIFKQRVLPFGSRHSVHGFCRVSLGLWRVAVTLLRLQTSVYFDDFVNSEIPCLSKLHEVCMDLLFKLLGWAIAGDKEVQFGSIAKVLGLKVDLSEAHLGRVFMTNTDSRRDEMFETISHILDDDFLSKKKGEQLRGRLQFAECQIAGRTSGMALKRLSRFVASGGGKLDDQIRATLLTLRDRVMFAAPRCVNANLQHVLHLYVDASNDDGKTGLGGILINEMGNMLGFFSEWASDKVRGIMNPDSRNPIFEFECLAVFLGLKVWGQFCSGCNLVIFTDNEAALSCLIKGSSDNSYGGRLVSLIHELCDEVNCNVWYERVNTCSNVADGPSRGQLSKSWGDRIEVDVENITCSALGAWGD